jgi:hypothetical protein
MAGLTSADLGKSDGEKKDGDKNVLHRIFVPSKPVLHAAVALKVIFQHLPGSSDGSKIGELLNNPQLLEDAVKRSEIIRMMIPRLKKPKIKEEETVQFVLD